MLFVPWIVATLNQLITRVNKTRSYRLDLRNLEMEADNLQNLEDREADDSDSTRP